MFAEESEVLGPVFSAGCDGHGTFGLLESIEPINLKLTIASHSARHFSLQGFTALAMTVRFLDGSYSEGGNLLGHVGTDLVPRFGDKGIVSVFSSNALILVCMLSTAYMAHFNAPKFYLELKNNTMARYHSVVSWSFGISILLMGAMTTLGFLTFGEACSGLVLNNYASSDVWMSCSRIAVAVSLVFS